MDFEIQKNRRQVPFVPVAFAFWLSFLGISVVLPTRCSCLQLSDGHLPARGVLFVHCSLPVQRMTGKSGLTALTALQGLYGSHEQDDKIRNHSMLHDRNEQ